MIIAEQKKKENIIEYLLYMYQIEDIIRAYEFDINRIEQSVINQFDVSYDVKREMLEWYRSLIERMKSEGKEKSGHLDFLNVTAEKLNTMHLHLIQDEGEQDYIESYRAARPNIEELRIKAGNSDDHDIQVILNGLYGLLMLRIKKIEISSATLSAFQTITEMLALLSLKYLEDEQVS